MASTVSATSTVTTAAVKEAAGKQATDISAVQTKVALSVVNITKQITTALMAGINEKLNFQKLAAKYVFTNEQLNATDVKIRLVFGKLKSAINEEIENKSKIAFPVLNTTLTMIEQQASQKDKDQFLAYFVHQAAVQLTEQLEKEQPMALKSPELWT